MASFMDLSEELSSSSDDEDLPSIDMAFENISSGHVLFDEDVVYGDEDDGEFGDPFYPPDDFVYDKHEQSHADVMGPIDDMAVWIHDEILSRLPSDPAGQDLPKQRIRQIVDKWTDFMLANETIMHDSKTISTYTDRTVASVLAAHLHMNLMQLYFVQTFVKLHVAGQQLRDRYEDNPRDVVANDVIEDIKGSWRDPMLPSVKWTQLELLDGESRGVRLFKIRVTHLGPLFDGWITALSEEEYNKDSVIRRLPKDAYVTHVMRQDPEVTDRDKVDPYIPRERMRLPWWKRVVEYSMNEVVRAIKLITRDVDMIDPSPRFIDFYDALVYANSRFFVETHGIPVLDMEEYRAETRVEGRDRPVYLANRTYSKVSYFYFWPIQHRLIFHKLYSHPHNRFTPVFRADRDADAEDIRWTLRNNRSRLSPEFGARSRYDDVYGVTAEEVAQTIAWIKTTVLPAVGKEGFNALYEECVEQAYRCPGDVDLFKLLHPQMPNNTSAVLRDIRPEDQELSSDLFQEYDVSLSSITTGIGGNMMSDTLAIYAVDRHWQSLVSDVLDWKQTYVIEAWEINHRAHSISLMTRPLIVRIFSSFCVVFEGRAYKPSGIIPALALWFKIIDRWFDGTLSWEARTDGTYTSKMTAKDMLADIFSPPTLYKDLGTMLGDRPME